MSVPVLGLARLSGLIYEDWRSVDIALAAAGLADLGRFDHADTQAMLVQSPGWAALVFRGTEASRVRVLDLVANFGFPVAWAGCGRAHSGYLRAFNRISFSARLMAEQGADEIPLYATGHSMGGCLATLFASWFYTEMPRYKLAGLVTFGAPKALDRAAAAAIACPIARYAIPLDFAQAWPPGWRLTHPAPAIALRSAQRWPGPVSRHSVDNYVASLGRA